MDRTACGVRPFPQQKPVLECNDRADICGEEWRHYTLSQSGQHGDNHWTDEQSGGQILKTARILQEHCPKPGVEQILNSQSQIQESDCLQTE